MLKIELPLKFQGKNRSEIIEALPQSLKPLAIVDNMAEAEVTKDLIDVTEKLYTDYFASYEFNTFIEMRRKEIVFNYQILMETLRMMDEFSRRTFHEKDDVWDNSKYLNQ